MKKAIAFFIQHPLWANALIVLTVIFGLLSLFSMGSSFFPELTPNQVFVNVFYPGASPEEMEEGVTIKIEEAVKGINDIDEIQSVSSENSARITIIAYQGSDMENMLAEVKNAVDGINSFPVGAEKPIVFKQKSHPMSERAAIISIIGDVDNFALKEYADNFEDQLLKSEEISQIEISGLPPLEISIEVNEDDLQRYNLRIEDLVSAVRANNRDISGGNIKAADEELIIRSRAKSIDPHVIEQIPLRAGNTGSYIAIGDVATVKLQFAESPIKSMMNGKNSVTLSVKKLPSEDLTAIGSRIRKEIEIFNDEHTDVEVVENFMFSTVLEQRIELLSKNGILGLMLVLFTLGLFLNIRLSLWVAFGIPFSFLGMFIIGILSGTTINMISLFGMILVVGILVDDGIVIAENIFVHFEKGKHPFQAAYDGTVEVASAVFTSVLTTIVAFTALFFIEGMERMYEMAFVVIMSLSFSLIEAFFILPTHLANEKVLKESKKGIGHGIRSFFNKIIITMRDDYYGFILKWLVKHPRYNVIIPLLFIIIVISLVGFNVIRNTFFPAIPFDDFNVEIAFTPGDREDVTEAYLMDFYEKVWEVNNEIYEEIGDSVITYVSVTVGMAGQLGEIGGHAGSIRVSLDVEDKPISSFEIADRVRNKIGPIPEANKYMVGGLNRWGKPVLISVSGEDNRKIKAAKEYLKTELKKNPELKDVTDNAGVGKREILLELKPRAYMLGLNTAMIMGQIREGFFGSEVQRLIIGRDEVRVWVRYPIEDRMSIGMLEEMRIKTNQGLSVPLKEVADFKIERGEVSIRHYDGIREVLVEADLIDPYASVPEILQNVRADIIPGLKANFPGVNIDFRGQQLAAEKSEKTGLIAILISLFVMMLIISLNFNSVYQSLLIALMLPMGVMGAILGHGIENLPVSILSAFGMIALMGILVNDAVVYLDTFNRNLLKGMDVTEAIYEAGISRFRPIVLTSITTVAGLYPLILETSFHAQFLIPMAVSVAYGVLFGTFFILLFFPVTVLIMNDFRRFIYWLWHGEKCERIDVEPVIQRKKKIKHINTNSSDS
ncbi:MAG: AcrB/AcrD/AcrF family protein [Bacteroidetes bacterium]|nr:MAG: AcrB/AcrD/AcrF family protein [Bacteroidota bacterium]